jgi:predicted RNA-binding Zn-ribbon protein involved in translation (DUF1610 family)
VSNESAKSKPGLNRILRKDKLMGNSSESDTKVKSSLQDAGCPETGTVAPQLPRKTELMFRCPKCGGNQLIEVLAQCKRIRVYVDSDWIWEPASHPLDGQTLHFQCVQCGYRLKDSDNEVQSISDLIDWLSKSGAVQ